MRWQAETGKQIGVNGHPRFHYAFSERSASFIAFTRPGAFAMRSGINPASGNPAQYFFGISDRMALSLRRAGLNTLE